VAEKRGILNAKKKKVFSLQRKKKETVKTQRREDIKTQKEISIFLASLRLKTLSPLCLCGEKSSS
jgi:hypothetical protein